MRLKHEITIWTSDGEFSFTSLSDFRKYMWCIAPREGWLHWRSFYEGVALYQGDTHLGNVRPTYPTPEAVKYVQDLFLVEGEAK